MILTGVTILLMTTVATVAVAQGGDSPCADGGFALGEWSVPINTLLLIILALIGNRTRRKVEKVEAVTEKVALRKTDTIGTARRRQD